MLHSNTRTHTMHTTHCIPHTIMLGFLISTTLTLTLTTLDMSIVMEWDIMKINSSSLSCPILLDPYGSMFMSTVLFISFNVLTFAKSYMLHEHSKTRFTHLVLLFILSMIAFILSPNLMTMMLGWDGLGITSFLLVIYYQSQTALKSGFITVMTNRIGDALIITAIVSMMSQGHWNILSMWQDSTSFPSLTALLLLLASMTKSAQLPFSAWLPEAMAAPTPVSALVHSSTLVTAGVFMLIRLYPFTSSLKWFNPSLMVVSALTMVMAGTWAGTEQDMKKVIALSTLSHLGLMLVSLSTGHLLLCYFHLITHALFKATFFISAGLAFNADHHHQGLNNKHTWELMPLVSVTMMISMASMAAMFFTGGFYSKDMIFESVGQHINFWPMLHPLQWLTTENPISPGPLIFLWLMLGYGAATTALYSTRIWRGVITTSPYVSAYQFYEWRSKYWSNNIEYKVNNSTNFIPLVFMSVGSVIMGSVVLWMFTLAPDLPIVHPLVKMAAPVFTLMGMNIAFAACRTVTKGKQISSLFSELTESQGIRHIMKSPKIIIKFFSAITEQMNPWYLRPHWGTTSNSPPEALTMPLDKFLMKYWKMDRNRTYTAQEFDNIISMYMCHMTSEELDQREKTLSTGTITEYNQKTQNDMKNPLDMQMLYLKASTMGQLTPLTFWVADSALYLSFTITKLLDYGWYALLVSAMNKTWPTKLSTLFTSSQPSLSSHIILTMVFIIITATMIIL